MSPAEQKFLKFCSQGTYENNLGLAYSTLKL